MVLQHRSAKTALPHAPEARQLDLFGQFGVTFGELEGSKSAVKTALQARLELPRPTRFAFRPGCCLQCECDRCLNGDT